MAVGAKNPYGSSGAGAAAHTVAASPTEFPSQCLREFLRRLVKVDPHPAVLDLGILCGANIAFLGDRGCRVSVESHPAATATAPAAKGNGNGSSNGAAAVPRSPLQYPPQSFSGILAWDAIARMSPAEAGGFVEGLRTLLLEGGVILAHFPPASNSSAGARYRIVSADMLALEPLTRRCAPPQNFQNREIYSLFARFEIVRVAQLKSGAREVLVTRSRKAGGD